VSLQDELILEIEGWGVPLECPLAPDTSLIESGVFDSMALFNLLRWIEDRIGEPVDPTEFDLAAEWETVDLVVRFVEERRASRATR
jgi:acyl carrier protein